MNLLLVILVVSVVLVTLLMSFHIPYVFGKDIPMKKVSGTSNVLKTLTEDSVAEVKKVVAHPKISTSISQLQHLGLDRDLRRAKNKQFVKCLADTQAEAFTVMKKRINKETCMKVIDDFSHTPSRLANLKDATEVLIEDLKIQNIQKIHYYKRTHPFVLGSAINHC